MNKVADYIKNLGKSMVFASVDIVGKNSPSTAAMMETNKDLFKDVYHSIRDYRSTLRRSKEIIMESKLYEAGSIGLNAAWEDALSGKLYNNEREFSAVGMKAMGMDMSDLDNDLNMEDGSEGSPTSEKELLSFGDQHISSTVVEASKASSATISSMIKASAEYSANVNKASTSLLYTQNTKLFGELKYGLASVNDNIGKLLEFSTHTIQAHAENSKSFYEITSRSMQETNAILKEMLQMQREEYKAKSETAKRNAPRSFKEHTRYGDIMGGSGDVDIKGYASNIKKNFNDILTENGAGVLNAFGDDSNMLASMAMNPLSIIPLGIANAFIGPKLKQAARSFDKTLSGVVGTWIAKMNYDNKRSRDGEGDALSGLIGRIFGIKDTVKGSIDAAKYNKDAVPFNGITQKAITEVIPTYLRQMVSILSGKKERMFNFDNGKWQEADDLKRSFKNIEKGHVENSLSDVRSGIHNELARNGELRFSTASEKIKFDKSIESILTKIYKDGGAFRPDKADYMDYGANSSRDLEMFKRAFKALPHAVQMQMGGSVQEERSIHNKQMEKLEQDGSIYGMLSNGNSSDLYINKDSKGRVVGGAHTLDKLGHDTFYYLRSMYKELMAIRKYGNGIGGGAVLGNVDDITIPDISKKSLRQIDSDRAESLEKRYSDTTDRLKGQKNSGMRVIEGEDDHADINRFTANVRRSKERMDAEELKSIAREDSFITKGLRSSIGNMRNKADLKLEDEKNPEAGYWKRLTRAGSLGEKFAIIVKGVDKLTSSPGDKLVSLLRKADDSIYEFFFGDDKDKTGKQIKGFLGRMNSKLSEVMEKFGDFVDKNIFTPLKKRFEVDTMGGLASKIFNTIVPDSIKDGAKEIWSGIKDKTSEYFKDAREAITAAAIKTKEDLEKALSKNSETNQPSIVDAAAKAVEKAPTSNFSKYASAINSVNIVGYDKKAEKAKFKEKSKAKYAIDKFTGLLAEAKANGNTNQYDTIYSKLQAAQATYDSIELADGPATIPSSRISEPTSKDLAKLNAHNAREAKRAALAPTAEPAEESISTSFKPNSSNAIAGTTGLIQIGNSISTKILDVLTSIYEKISGITASSDKGSSILNQFGAEIQNKADGSKYIRKSGLTAISEGEMVIPSEMNPLNPNRNSVNKSSEIKNERKIKKDFAKNIVDGIGENATGNVTLAPTDKLNKSLDILSTGTDNLTKGLKTVFGTLFVQDSDKKDGKFDAALDDITSNVSKYIPEGVAGGLLAGTIGLVTGIASPLLLAVGGSAVAIASNSSKMQDWLFGSKDDKGERGGGVFDKNDQDWAKSLLPDLQAYGITGTVLGMLTPGVGALGGLVLGSGIAYAKHNKDFMDFMFGEENGLVGKETQAYLKKALPNMAIGGVIGAGLGLLPELGVLGVGTLGVVGGLIATTDTFQDFILGHVGYDKKRSGGLVGLLKVNIVNPLYNFGKEIKDNFFGYMKTEVITPISKAMAPIGKDLRMAMSKTIEGIGTFAKKLLTQTLTGLGVGANLQRWVLNPVKSVLGVGKSAMQYGAKKLLSGPAHLIGKYGDMRRRSHIRNGNADYMTAAERLEWAQEQGVDGYDSGSDKALSELDLKEVSGFKERMDIQKHGGKDVRARNQNAIKDLKGEILHKFDAKTAQKIVNALNNGDRMGSKGDLDKLLTTGFDKNKDSFKNDPKEYTKYLEAIKEKLSTYDESEKSLSDFTDNEDAFKSKLVADLEAKGINVDPNKNGLDKFNKLLAKEKRSRESVNARKKEENKVTPEENTAKIAESTTVTAEFTKKMYYAMIGKTVEGKPLTSSEATKELSKTDDIVDSKKEDKKWVEETQDGPITMEKKSDGSPGPANTPENKITEAAKVKRLSVMDKLANGIDSMGGWFKGKFDKLIGKKDKKESIFDLLSGAFTKLLNSSTVLGVVGAGLLVAMLPLAKTAMASIWDATKNGIYSIFPFLDKRKKNDKGESLDENGNPVTDADGANGRSTIKAEGLGLYSGGKMAAAALSKKLGVAVGPRAGVLGKMDSIANGGYKLVKGIGKAGLKVASHIPGAGIVKGIGKYGLKAVKSVLPGAESISKITSKFNIKSITKATESVVSAPASQKMLGWLASQAKMVAELIEKRLPSLAQTPFVKRALEKLLLMLTSPKFEANVAEVAMKKFGASAATIGAKAASALSGVGTVIYVGSIVAGIGTGMYDAKAILGLSDDKNITFLQRTFAGVCGGLSEALFGIIPYDTIASVVIWVLDTVGVDVSQLKADRTDSENKLAEYNEQHPEDQAKDMSDLNEKTNPGIITSAKNLWNKYFSNPKDKKAETDANKTASNGSDTTSSSNTTGNNGSSADGKYGRVRYGKGGYYSQLDPSLDMQFNTSNDSQVQTMRDSGCGPVSASNALLALKGNNDVEDPKAAAKYALDGGYKETDGGTTPGFFKDYFSKNGVDSQYTNGTGITDQLNSGHPVVLMGTDKTGPQTGKTPFGPNPHYVTATGLDGRGNMIVQDPEGKQNARYKASDMIRSSTVGVAAKYGTGRRFSSRYGRGFDDDNTDTISEYCANAYAEADNYKGLKETINQVASEVNISPYLLAGIMFKESGFHPRKGAADDYGSDGYMQIIDDTAAFIKSKTGCDCKLGGYYDIWAGAWYLRFRIINAGSVYAGVKGYNGSGSAADAYATVVVGDYTGNGGINPSTESRFGGKPIANIATSGTISVSGNKAGTPATSGGLIDQLLNSSPIISSLKSQYNSIFGGVSVSGNTTNKTSTGSKATISVSGNAEDSLLNTIKGESPAPEYASVTSEYGPRGNGFHKGVDIGIPVGTPLPSLVDGVADVGEDPDGYGHWAEVKDKQGNLHLYGHLNEQSVANGQQVTKGDIIGMSGNTGHSTGPHVHYDITTPSDEKVDPSGFSLSGLGKRGLNKGTDAIMKYGTGLPSIPKRKKPKLKSDEDVSNPVSKYGTGGPDTPSEYGNILQAILNALLVIVQNTATSGSTQPALATASVANTQTPITKAKNSIKDLLGKYGTNNLNNTFMDKDSSEIMATLKYLAQQ